MTRIAPLALLALVTGCIGPGFVHGNGTSATEDRDVGAFTEVHADNLVRVEVSTGPAAPVSLTCDENLLAHIETVVDGGVLKIRTERLRSLSTDIDCFAVVTAPAYTGFATSGSGGLVGAEVFAGVTGIFSTGSGALVLDGVDAASLSARVSGSGGLTVGQVTATFVEARDSGSGRLQLDDVLAESVDAGASGSGGVVLSGTTDFADLHTSGSGGIDAEDLLARTVEIRVSGSGGVNAQASDSADVSVSGSGGVAVYGSPAQHTENITGSGGVVYP
ncbi:MAG: head GIN domain-containing protein [Myxococcota bacterium]